MSRHVTVTRITRHVRTTHITLTVAAIFRHKAPIKQTTESKTPISSHQFTRKVSPKCKGSRCRSTLPWPSSPSPPSSTLQALERQLHFRVCGPSIHRTSNLKNQSISMRPDSKEPIPAMHPLVRRRTSRWTLLQHGRILGGCRQINLNKRRILDASTNGSHHQVWHHQDATAIILDLAMFQQSWIQDPCPAAGDGCASKNPQAMTMRPGPRIPGHSDCFHWNWLLGCRCAFQGRIHLQKPKGRQTDTGTCLGAAVAPRQEPVSGCLATVY